MTVMKSFHLIVGFAAGALTVSAAQSPKAPVPPGKATAPAVVTNAPVVIPQSVFVVPQSSRDGRNPFFPNSTLGQEAPKTKTAAPSIASFVLNGITSPPRRTAMINGRTFEVGETGEIRLADGSKAKITCEEIRDTSALISVNGERRELHLRASLR